MPHAATQMLTWKVHTARALRNHPPALRAHRRRGAHLGHAQPTRAWRPCTRAPRPVSRALRLQPPGCTAHGDLAEPFSNRPIAARAAPAAARLNLGQTLAGWAVVTARGEVPCGLGPGGGGFPRAVRADCSKDLAALGEPGPRAGNSVVRIRGVRPGSDPRRPGSPRPGGARPPWVRRGGSRAAAQVASGRASP